MGIPDKNVIDLDFINSQLSEKDYFDPDITKGRERGSKRPDKWSKKSPDSEGLPEQFEVQLPDMGVVIPEEPEGHVPGLGVVPPNHGGEQYPDMGVVIPGDLEGHVPGLGVVPPNHGGEQYPDMGVVIPGDLEGHVPGLGVVPPNHGSEQYPDMGVVIPGELEGHVPGLGVVPPNHGSEQYPDMGVVIPDQSYGISAGHGIGNPTQPEGALPGSKGGYYDFLVDSAESDTFVFTAGYDEDTTVSSDHNADILAFEKELFSSYEEIVASAYNSGDIVLERGGDTVRSEDISLNALDIESITFV